MCITCWGYCYSGKRFDIINNKVIYNYFRKVTVRLQYIKKPFKLFTQINESIYQVYKNLYCSYIRYLRIIKNDYYYLRR